MKVVFRYFKESVMKHLALFYGVPEGRARAIAWKEKCRFQLEGSLSHSEVPLKERAL